MTRPTLELRVFPPIPECPPPSDFGYAYEDWFDDRRHERKLVERKRLTDIELAAEVFRQAAWLGANGRAHKTDEGRNIVIEAAFTFGPMTRDEYEYLIISQVAQRPHYDEVDA